MSKRHGNGPGYVVGADTARLDERVLLDPIRWRQPRKIFVGSMTDLFEERVHDLWIGRIFGTMAEAYWHEFQVLTKRAERLYELSKAVMHYPKGDRSQKPVFGWPPNVWVGVSAEDQQRADERIPWLLQTPAAVRFVSLEPLLGPIDLSAWPKRMYLRTVGRDGAAERPGLDWVIVGGESGGPPERALVERCRGCVRYKPSSGGWCDGCDATGWSHQGEGLEWVRSIRDQCVSAGVQFFFKQWGGATPKSGGRLLDGRTWDEMPK